MVISVFLADENLNVREGLNALLDLEGDLTVVVQAADYDSLVSGIEDVYPQVIVIDIPCRPTSRARASKSPYGFVSMEPA